MERKLNTAIVRINADIPCKIYRFCQEIGTAQSHDYTEIYLPKGRHRLSFVSLSNANDKIDIEKEILDVEYEDIIDVNLCSVRDVRIAKEHAEAERKRQEKLIEEKRELVRLAELRRKEDERKKREEALKPYKFPQFPKLNFYDCIGCFEYGFNNPKKYIIAEKGELRTLIDRQTFMPIIPFEFDDIKECNGNGDYLWVSKNKKWGLYNVPRRNFILSPQFGSISRSFECRNCYTLITTKEGKFGAVNDKGDIIVECKFEELYENRAGLFVGKLNGKEGVLDAYGNVKIPFIYQELWLCGTHPSILNGKYGVLSGNGSVICDFVYDKIEYCEPFGCGYHVLVKNGKYGVHVCGTGQNIPCIYDSFDDVPNFKLN